MFVSLCSELCFHRGGFCLESAKGILQCYRGGGSLEPFQIRDL